MLAAGAATLRAVLLLLGVTAAVSAQPASTSERVEALLRRMTLEEKVGEMTQLTIGALSRPGAPAVLDSALLERALRRDHVGSLLNVWETALTPAQWSDLVATVQRVADRTRLGIPILYGLDAVHGANYIRGATLFPQNIALAATWDPPLVREVNAITARELRAVGVPWNFSPVLDLGRQPLWSRFFETFGEDVHLATTLGVQAVEGLQGVRRAALPLRVAATAKHFLGYSMPLSGRDRTTAWIPERQLREYFLPSFRAAIAAGVRAVMVNSGDVNGIPVHSSRELLTDLLREELGFTGVVVSDWQDIERLVSPHHVAATQREAVRLAIRAGIDMSMTPHDTRFAELLLALVHAGEVSEVRIDQSVRRILTLKMDLGLFEDARPDTAAQRRIGVAAAQAVSRQAAEEAVTVLENRGVLPLSPQARVLITGPGATSLPAQFGGWSYTWQGRDSSAYPPGLVTFARALAEEHGPGRVNLVESIRLDGSGSVGEAVRAAAGADVVIVALAEPPSTEKPGDIETLDLPAAERDLALALERTGKPVIVTLFQNRPRILRPIVDSARAIVLAYQTGPYGGTALARVLTGAVNPSGRLPFTYPRASGAIEHYDHAFSAEAFQYDTTGGYRPEWDFGHGLSYTRFTYDTVTLARTRLRLHDTLVVHVRLRNAGTRGGDEVIQLYVRQLVASITPPVKRLRAYRRLSLAAGAVAEAEMRVPVRELGFVGRDNREGVEPGEFEVLVGGRRLPFRVE